jgi:hypothetical protein
MRYQALWDCSYDDSAVETTANPLRCTRDRIAPHAGSLLKHRVIALLKLGNAGIAGLQVMVNRAIISLHIHLTPRLNAA